MDQDAEYMTLADAAKRVGVKKGTLYYYFRVLGIKTHKFQYNKHVYIAKKDVEHILAVREHPWNIGEDENGSTLPE
jgi:hypothetical protein